MNHPIILQTVLLTLILSSCELAQTPETRNFPDARREVFILNSLAETISVYHPDTAELYNDAVTTGTWPNDILYHDGRLYVVNSGDNSIWVYDESTLARTGEIYLGPNRNPWTIIPSGDGPKAYVPNWVAGSISVIDLETLTLLSEIENAGQGPEGGCSTGGKIYVCCTGYTASGFGEGSVAVIETAGDTMAKIINTGEGSNPQSAFAVNGTVYVILSGRPSDNSGGILVIDTATDTVVQSLPTGGEPSVDPQALDRDRGIAYLSGNGGVMALNYTASPPLLLQDAVHPVYGTQDLMNSYPGVVYHEDILYVTDFNNDKFVVIDLNTGGTTTLDGSYGPQELVYTEE
ncbi:MAG: YncE family protein [Spirochaetales bacterium]|nr:YncE family protein [Spirochaetales bacterium]